ncbi:hypothetical protein CRG98_024742 [Punica granatum]|uniref:HTH myb-type domain-containing protein n=1 Tax=Punica granatum TaxID=22663 RepID=A0A2I0JF40_PUNGR|nr:hypothetical protein CRG98_024742 [Punica granatum]
MDNDDEGSAIQMCASFQALDDGVANGGTTLDGILALDKQLPVPVAVPEDVRDHGQLAIVPSEAGQEQKKKEAVSEAVNNAAGQHWSSRKEHGQDAIANGGMILDDTLGEQLPLPIAVPEGDVDRGQSAIIPGDLVEKKRKRKEEAVGDLVEQKPERKKVVSWTEDDHRIFLLGLHFIASGPKKWKTMSKYLLPNKGTSEIASHAQKYHKRQERKEETLRKSINDTILRKEDIVRLFHLIWEKHKPQQRLELSQAGAALTVLQSHAGQFHQVPGAYFPAGQVQHHLHQMPMMGAPADPRPSFGACGCGQTHQIPAAPPVTWNVTQNTPNCASSGGTPQIHQWTSRSAPATGPSWGYTRPHTQSIMQEFQPAPTAQPMVEALDIEGYLKSLFELIIMYMDDICEDMQL